MRTIINLDYRAHSTPLFSKIGILDIFYVNTNKITKFMFCYKNNLLPPLLLNLFVTNSQIYCYGTRTGIFQRKLKIAKIILIYKAEHPSFFVNYRPISLLSNFSNFFKKVIYNHSVEFAKKYDKCFHCHFGFWKPLDIQNSDSSVNYLI